MRKHLVSNSRRFSTRAFYSVLFGVSFSLNWVWEMAQMFANQTELNEGWLKVFLSCTGASVIDAVVTVGIYALLARLMKPNQAKFYIGAAVLGALCAIGFEWLAFRFGLWSYSEQMVVLPVIGTGLLPFIQLTILVPSAIWLTSNLKGI